MSRAICAAARNASIASSERPARKRAVPSSSCVSARRRGSSMPSSSADAKRAAASSKASVLSAARPASSEYSIARRGPSTGAAAPK